MTIKLRILIFVLTLQMLGYGFLLAHSLGTARNVLTGLRGEQIGTLFEANLSRINAQTDLMERSAQDLAVAGESLLRLLPALSAQQLEAATELHLLALFRRFPQSIGGGLWFEPYLVDPSRRLFGPYAFWQGEEVVFTWDLSSESYDYLSQAWYRAGLPDDWPRDQKRPQAVYWTEPYYDEAGSEALMMTVDAPMHRDGRIVGMATVDWSTEAMRELVAEMSITPGSHAFLIEPRSGRFVTNTLDPDQVMKPVRSGGWAEQALQAARAGELGKLERVDINGESTLVYFMATRIGLVFGALVPRDEVLGELNPLLQRNLWAGVLISILFLIIVMVVLGLLFRPFSRILAQITGSIRKDEVTGHVELTPLHIPKGNEFRPIVAALNDIYADIGNYTERLSALNEHLSRQQAEIGELNTSLERKVGERTAQLKSKNAELQLTIDQLTMAQNQLVEAEKHSALGRLVAGIAHEINTPLGIAVTASSHLQDKASRLERRFAEGALRRSEVDSFFRDAGESLDILGGNLERAARLVSSFKQISVDQSSEVRRRFELHHYLGDILLSLRPALKRVSHHIEVDCPQPLWLDSYPGAWSQIITNLVMNTLTHAFDEQVSGHIRIVVRSHSDAVSLVFEDDGAGVPVEDLDKIFDPFFTTSRAHGGSGLGLSVVYNLATRTLGGRVRCSSVPGQGLRLEFDLPMPSP